MQSPRHRFRSIAAISVAVLAVSGPSHAQSAEAEKLFNDGTALMAEGKVAQACEAFAASNRVEPRAGTLILLGDCRERTHQLASAWSAYKDALGRAKDPRKRSYAAAKVAALEPRLSYLTVQVTGDHRLAGLTILRDGTPFDAALWNRALPLDGGDYQLTVRAPGHVEWTTTARVPLENGKLTIAVPRLNELPEPAPGLPVAPAPLVTTTRLTAARKLALGLAGVGVASLAVGIALGVTANGKKDDAFALCPDAGQPCTRADDANALLSSSHSWAAGANVAYGLSLASVAAATILWVTGGPSQERPRRVSVRPSVTPGSVGIVGSIGW